MPPDAGYLIERGFVLDLLAEEHAAAERVLAGEPTLIMPRGTFHRNGGTFVVDDETIAEFVDNWVHRADRGIRRTQLAVDINHDGRAVGWYQDILPVDGGLGARFSWTPAGQKALSDGEFAYFSPSVYWKFTDPHSGEIVNNQVVGGALTNYPFFGEQTALYCLTADGDSPVFFVVTKGDAGQQYPAQAYLIVGDTGEPSTWHFRVMSWQGADLKPDHELMAAALDGTRDDEALRRLRALYDGEGLDFKIEGGFAMTGQEQNVVTDTGWAQFGQWVASFLPPIGGKVAAPPPPPAQGEGAGLQAQVVELMTQFSNLQEQFEAVAGERDAAQAARDALQASLVVVQDERAGERFAALVREQFSHLPPTPADLAGHVQWLFSMDTEDEQPHATFFSDLLQKADEKFAEAFRESGESGESGGDAMAMIATAVAEYQGEHPDVNYSTALDAVLSTNKDLFASYEAQRGDRGGGR